MQNKIIGILTVLLISACNSNDKTTTSTSTDSTKTENATTTTPKGAPRANIEVTIGGGDMAGTYTAVCTDACCSWGIAGEKVFGNQYSETGKGAKELSSVQLIIDDVSEGNKTTKNFQLTVGFGDFLAQDPRTFNIVTSGGKSEGSGTAEVRYSGNTATVTIKGVSKEGQPIDLKMECVKVMNSSNILD